MSTVENLEHRLQAEMPVHQWHCRALLTRNANQENCEAIEVWVSGPLALGHRAPFHLSLHTIGRLGLESTAHLVCDHFTHRHDGHAGPVGRDWDKLAEF